MLCICSILYSKAKDETCAFFYYFSYFRSESFHWSCFLLLLPPPPPPFPRQEVLGSVCLVWIVRFLCKIITWCLILISTHETMYLWVL